MQLPLDEDDLKGPGVGLKGGHTLEGPAQT